MLSQDNPNTIKEEQKVVETNGSVVSISKPQNSRQTFNKSGARDRYGKRSMILTDSLD